MVVLAVVAILLAVGIPGLRGIVQSQKIATTASDLFAAIHLARSEAIQRGARVDLVPAGDGTDWSRGWVVLIDKNGNQRADPGEQIIFSHGPVAAGVTIKAAFTDAKTQYLAYNGSGRTRTNANSQAPQLGSWSIVLDNEARRIVINFLGRPRVCNPNVATGSASC
jgi:type IV fimbrial biogenesis protein FimT